MENNNNNILIIIIIIIIIIILTILIIIIINGIKCVESWFFQEAVKIAVLLGSIK